MEREATQPFKRQARAAILAIGDEIIRGEKQDTNSGWLALQLGELGVRVVEFATTPDDSQAITSAICRLSQRSDFVIATGGLGPTPDDLTRRGLADALGCELVFDQAAVADIEARFARIGAPMCQSNRVQAMRPDSASILTNPHGTAPGLVASLSATGGAARIFCLPGPPREMQPMFKAHVVVEIGGSSGGASSTRLVHVFGMGESELAERLGDLMNRGRNPEIGTTAHAGIVTCRIRSEGGPREIGAAIERTERTVRDRLDARVFGVDDDTLESVVVALLRERNERLVTAESCTGGLVGATLTNVPGASDVYLGGWVTYANTLKMRELGVPKSTLAANGAVSDEVAQAMAEGALRSAPEATMALAITGVAGPTGGSDDKPVGTVHIGICSKLENRNDAARVWRFRFPGERAFVRSCATSTALALVRLALRDDCVPSMLWEQQ